MFYRAFIETLADFGAWGRAAENLKKAIELGNLSKIDELANELLCSGDRLPDEIEINDFLHFTLLDCYPDLIGEQE